MAESIIKQIYRNRFAKYNPFYFELEFQFDMNSWIPIKLVNKEKHEDSELFELIKNNLANDHLVIITGRVI